MGATSGLCSASPDASPSSPTSPPRHPQASTADSLLALFWPELDQEHARAALRQALHVVRDALGADVIVTRGDEEVGLDFERIWCDVVAFDAVVAAEQFDEALGLYQGDLLEGLFSSGAGELV